MVPNRQVVTILAPIKLLSTQTECARKVCWFHLAASLQPISPMKVIRHIPSWPPSQNIMGMKWHTMGWFSQSEPLASAMFSLGPEHYSLTAPCCLLKMGGPEPRTSSNDRSNHLALPHRPETWRGRNGGGLQSGGREART